MKLIKERIKINYEILLLDNREKDSTIIEPLYDVILSDGVNYKNYGRIKMIKYSSGDYIWFIDADDEILELNIDDIKNINNEDVIKFDYYREDEYCQSNKKNTYQLWSNWYKASNCKNMLNILDSNCKISMCDDNIISSFLERDKYKILFINKPIYKYRHSVSIFFNNDIKSIDVIDNYIINFKIYRKEIEKIEKVPNNISRDICSTAVSYINRNCSDEKYIEKRIIELYYVFPEHKKDILKSIFKITNKNVNILKIVTEWTKLSQCATEKSVVHNTI